MMVTYGLAVEFTQLRKVWDLLQGTMKTYIEEISWVGLKENDWYMSILFNDNVMYF